MTKTSSGNFFEDFRLGQTIRHATPRTVTELHRRGVVVKVVSHGGRHLYDAGR